MPLYSFSQADAESVLRNEICEALEAIEKYTQCPNWNDVTMNMLTKLNKTQLVECLNLTVTTIGVSFIGAVLLKKQIALQETIISKDEELLKSKTEQFKAVQSTLKTELRSYCDVAKKGLTEGAITAVPNSCLLLANVALIASIRDMGLMSYVYIKTIFDQKISCLQKGIFGTSP